MHRPRTDRPLSTAERYLAVASDLARRGGLDTRTHLTSQVGLADLADRLGITRTALYRRWPTRHDFWVDLTGFLALGNDFVQPELVMPWNRQLDTLDELDDLDDLVETPESIDVVRRTINGVQDVVLADPWIVVRAAQLAYTEMPELAHARARVEQARLDQMSGQVADRLQRHSLTTAPPLTVSDVGVTMWCVSDGLGVASWYLPEVASQRLSFDDGAGPRPWSLLAFVYRALLFEATVPDRAATPAAEPPHPPPVTPDQVDLPAVSDRWNAGQRDALAAATIMLLERLAAETPRPRLELVGHVTVDRIARAAGVSRRAIYDIWPSRDDLVLDLLGVLLDEDAQRMGAVFETGARRAASGDPPPTLGQVVDALLFDGVEGGSESFRPHEGHELEQAVLAALPQAHRPPINALLRDRHHQLVDALATPITSIVCADGAVLRPEVTPEHLTQTVLALIEGARRLLRSNPAAVRPPAPSTRSTFGAAADALATASVDR